MGPMGSSHFRSSLVGSTSTLPLSTCARRPLLFTTSSSVGSCGSFAERAASGWTAKTSTAGCFRESRVGTMAVHPNLRLRGNIWTFEKKVKGRRYRISTGFSKDNREAANRRAVEIENDILSAKYGWKNITTVKQWLLTYLRTYTPRKARGTQRRDKAAILALIAEMGDKAIAEVTKSMCQAWVNKRRTQLRSKTYVKKSGEKRTVSLPPVAEGTVTRDISTHQAIWQQAIEEGILTSNPWRPSTARATNHATVCSRLTRNYVSRLQSARRWHGSSTSLWELAVASKRCGQRTWTWQPAQSASTASSTRSERSRCVSVRPMPSLSDHPPERCSTRRRSDGDSRSPTRADARSRAPMA
jgi:hypothetical protein